tara:strand:- start:42 stop:548 length:507 start_codon:yes stop_codon:yes gene_type:complete
MKNSILELDKDCQRILRHSLIAVSPQEGCAILLGIKKDNADDQKTSLGRITVIWPCCNIWEDDIFNINSLLNRQEKDSKTTFSRENRFAIDPREQLLAQKWARKQNLSVIGTAHSHTASSPFPSKEDLAWSFNDELICICDRTGNLCAWLIKKGSSPRKVKINYIDSQ